MFLMVRNGKRERPTDQERGNNLPRLYSALEIRATRNFRHQKLPRKVLAARISSDRRWKRIAL